ncbi:HlyC/CorC family transporter, partial [bacterium]|nr:HlyC/CorC family transporter [bacterium]
NLLGVRGEKQGRSISRDELMILLGMGVASGTVSERPHRMVKGIMSLKEIKICEIMVPRVKMIGIDLGLSLPAARKLAIEGGYSRIPIYEGSIDHIVGMVYFKDLFLRETENTALKTLMTQPVFIPESENAYKLLRDMRSRRYQTAIVLDEFGAVSGIVALEDLIEEVVGEIYDELDEPIYWLRLHQDGSMTIRTEVDLNTLEKETGVSWNNPEQATTMNGLILAYLGRIPATGECLILEGHRMEVVQADPKRVIMVRVYPKQD